MDKVGNMMLKDIKNNPDAEKITRETADEIMAEVQKICPIGRKWGVWGGNS